MPLAPGSSVGVFEVVALIGQGGMGEVYRARDRRLNRDVALKVVRDAFLHDAERSARFHREAQLLASLNHSNIGAIYGLEDVPSTGAGQAPTHVLVLEYVEGATLADRIARGPLPFDVALAIARQIADALEAAHERGIVHRDLKPANVKLRPDGTVKVLDFGLAKVMDSGSGGELPASPALTNSPTLTSPGFTAAGLLLGTAAYMSPEQARGQAVDKRADIWAFGCVLFEMLTGTAAFGGNSISDVLAGILKSEAPLAALPAVAAPLAPVLRRCLEKDVRLRLRDIADVKLLLEDAVEAASAPAPKSAPPPWQRGAALLTAAAVGAVISVAAVALIGRAHSQEGSARVERFQLEFPQSAPFVSETFEARVAVSPDGSRMAYSSTRGGTPVLATHRFDQLDAQIVAGSEQGFEPIFSPSGERLAFANFGELRRVDMAGGPSVSVCPIDAYFSGFSWSGDDSLIFAQRTFGLFRVSAAGGQPERIAVPDASKLEREFLSPFVLPGGAVVYEVGLMDGSVRVVARRPGDREATMVVADGFDPHYVAPGFLVYGQGDRLMAVRFDPARLKTEGAPVVVQEGAFTNPEDGVANFSVAANGRALLVLGHHTGLPGGIVWLDPTGARNGPALAAPLENPRFPRLSPDGRRMVVTAGPPGNGRLWIYALDGSSQPSKLTFHDHALFGTWSPNGRQIAFMQRSTVATQMMVIASDGSEVEPRPLAGAEGENIPYSWRGDSLLFGRLPGKLWMLHVPDGKATPWLDTPFIETTASISPDGRWIAYSTNQTGSNEIWVRAFSGAGAPVRVSNGGGVRPLWRHDGGEIYFENRGRMFGARVATQGTDLRAEAQRLVLSGGFNHDETDANARFLDVAQDGRFLAVEAAKPNGPASVVLLEHWDNELQRLLSK